VPFRARRAAPSTPTRAAAFLGADEATDSEADEGELAIAEADDGFSCYVCEGLGEGDEAEQKAGQGDEEQAEPEAGTQPEADPYPETDPARVERFMAVKRRHSICTRTVHFVKAGVVNHTSRPTADAVDFIKSSFQLCPVHATSQLQHKGVAAAGSSTEATASAQSTLAESFCAP
jgi:hypothetical protein